MAEDGNPSRYVKLNKEHEAPLEEIQPGELNQPVAVSQLVVHRCRECNQPLPESYAPPGNEPWTTGICGCAEDFDSCWLGLICPCILFGRNVERLKDVPWTGPCTCHAIFVEGGLALAAVTLAFHGVNPHAAFLVGEGLLFTWWMCGIYTGLFRQELQKKYHLQNSPCDPCLVHCCMHWCALCQEHREMQGRLSDDVVLPMTIINPPAVQEMHVPEGPKIVTANGTEEGISVQVQAL